VIIHAYAVNDSHMPPLSWSFSATATGGGRGTHEYNRVKNLVQIGFERLNSFAKEVYESRPCPNLPLCFICTNKLEGMQGGSTFKIMGMMLCRK